MKKSYLSLILSMLSTVGFAGNGFYVGAGLGPDLAQFNLSSRVSQVQNGILNFNVKNTDELSGTGIFGTLFAGYGFNFNCNWYLAGELNANLSSLQHTNSNKEFVHLNFSNTKFKMQHSYGISALPGYMVLDNTLFYGRLGYANGNLKVSTTDSSLANRDKNLSGFRWGLGLRQMLGPQFAVRMEYSQVDYQNLTLSTLDTLSNTAKTTKITPRTNEVEFGFIYLFC